MSSVRGKLLLSAPSLFDPNFRRTVILVAEHTDEGALGLVLNRASEASVGEAVPGLAWLTEDPHEPVFAGGPVATDSVIVLAEFDRPELAAALVMDDLGFVPATAVDGDADELGAATRRTRVFAGHAGWGPGQLDDELADNAWMVEPAQVGDVFTDDPEGLWGAVLGRKGGEWRLLAAMPVDPSRN